ncbi:beta-L-arabinofuranosidase domain-containing protein [Chitinophaga rhizophila]|uniref:Glycoside hydrolase family 127 protein n=1 Tax=Chitinophaga rhizophila TaxID=2866212 RepID=A0ABS7GJV6_9BACT|nr:beta-L-arabinofuranosidase domain-containing protein [Chitinophaga rhizophila]MBW8687994.1 glycoside hydrolase family 127 protein [Chitinophaga rhizophila]
MLRSALLTSLLLVTSFLSQAQNGHTKAYYHNRAPLSPQSYTQLPLGSIKAKGWLLKQLELQRDGATGHAEELYPEPDNLGPASDWLGGSGSGWERVPYYVKGLVTLAYTLDDTTLKRRSEKWIRWTLNNQHADGLFGPAKMKDWWPRMPMMYALQSYYEATGDPQVIPFLTRYFKYQLDSLDSRPLYEWSKSRTGDNIDIIFWLYNRTGDQFLLELARKLDQQAYPWAAIYSNNAFYHFGDDFHTKHSVSVGQALKFPVLYGQLNHDQVYQQATSKGIAHLLRDHGLAGIIASGTEFLSGSSSFQGVETCTVVEWMQSLETASRIIHDATLGDQLEKIAFNALPAQFSRDIKSHLYYTQPNQLFCKHGNSGFDEDYDGGILLSPYSGMGCCRYNMHMGWPYFVKNSWAATPDKGLAVIAYAPVTVNALVAGGIPVTLDVVTDYPFGEKISINVAPKQAAAFPLTLRIPSWCKAPEIAVNGTKQQGVQQGSIYRVTRTWKEGDQVVLRFPMEVGITEHVNRSVTVARGPLVYGLKMDAAYTIRKEHPVKGFYDYEVKPVSPWNYALEINPQDPGRSVKVVQRPMPENPFEQSVTPVTLSLKGRRLPSWKVADDVMHAAEVPESPVASNEQLEDIILTPYGSENIRISNFPVVGNAGQAVAAFNEDFSSATLASWINYGQWFIKDGAIHAASNKGSWGYGIHGVKSIASGVTFYDLSYEATVTLGSAGNAGIIFRVSSPDLGADAYNGYYLGLDAMKGKVQLGKASGGKWEVLKEYAQLIEMNRAYKVRVTAKGNKLDVYIDKSSTPVITVKDGTFNGGSIGVRSYDCMASIDNIKVQAL